MPAPNSPTAPTPVELTDDEALVHSLVQQSNELAGRYADHHEQDWKDHFYKVIADHPHTEVRAGVAAKCSLGLLRHYAIDPDPYVRWSATGNPFAIDADVQETLAADPDGRVVLGLIHHVDPGICALQIIIAGHHSDAKQILASRCRLRSDLIEALAADRDQAVRAVARRNLAARVRRVHPAPARLELEEAA